MHPCYNTFAFVYIQQTATAYFYLRIHFIFKHTGIYIIRQQEHYILSDTDLQCSHCGVQLMVGQRHCGNCGTPTRFAEFLNQTTTAEAPSQTSTDESTLDPTILPRHTKSASSQQPVAQPEQPPVQPEPEAEQPARVSYPDTASNIPVLLSQKDQQEQLEHPYPYPYPQPGPEQPGPEPAGYPANAPYPPYQAQQPYPPYQSQGQQPYPPYQGQAQQPYPAPYPPYNPNAPYPPYPQKKSNGARIAVIVLLSLLAVVVVICGVGYKVVESNLNAISSTAGKSSIPPDGTTPVPTVNDAPAPTGTPLLTDDFTNSSQGWQTATFKSDRISFQNGGLNMQDSDTTYLVEPVPHSDTLSDFRMDLSYIPSLGGAHGGQNLAGIIFRQQKVADNTAGPKGYLLKIDSEGVYVIRKVTQPVSASNANSKYVDLKQGAMDSPPLPGTPIDITLIVKGPSMALYLDGSYQDTITDTSAPFTQGNISLFVENAPDNTAAAALFQHIDIYPAPATLPTN
ncbi:zinc ribbon domain-containing protein [Ktedonobacteria bacterium brp13]|nr:zinc ribbon domain-containing protein [Ktedonobacteria bacterium brp13]